MRHNAGQPDRCTAEDYRELFASKEDEFEWLCYALTGNSRYADLSLDHAFEESLQSGTRVFREWMLSWARRLIIKSCIAAMDSEIQHVARDLSPGKIQLPAHRKQDPDQLRKMARDVLQKRLLALDVLSRFVVVLRTLEGYSRRETTLLLDVDEMTCAVVHDLAMASLGSSAIGETLRMRNQPMTA